MKKNFTGKIILSAIFLTFIISFASYIAINMQSILTMSLGAVEEIPTTVTPILPTEKPLTTASPSQTPSVDPVPTIEPEYIETVLNFPSEPVEFLEEVIPEIALDPDRDSKKVIETTLKSGTQVDNFLVSDSSGSGVDLLDYLKKDLPFDTTLTDEPMVLLYHTHTTESYKTNFTGYYYTDSSSRNTDPDKSVCIVGEAMKDVLESYGIKTIHDTTIHDYPEYNGSYTRSIDTVNYYLDKYPSIKITIDLHRDAMTASDGSKYKPTTEVNGKKAAQMMIIAGSDPNGSLGYTNWKENLVFEVKLQQKAEELYPDLMRPLMFAQRKYNMYVTNASTLIEVGTDVNTFSEAKYSGELMGKVMAEVILNG